MSQRVRRTKSNDNDEANKKSRVHLITILTDYAKHYR